MWFCRGDFRPLFIFPFGGELFGWTLIYASSVWTGIQIHVSTRSIFFLLLFVSRAPCLDTLYLTFRVVHTRRPFLFVLFLGICRMLYM
jgi:hypothetical protein